MHDLLTLTNTQTDADPKLTAFLEEGCGCKRNGGKPCYTSFSREQYEASWMQCAELSRSELDLVILGQIAALLKDSSQTNAHRQASQRQRTTMVFHHHGVPTCRETFLKLHGIGKMGYNKKGTTLTWCVTGLDRLKNVKASYLASGLTTRIHGNCRRRPKHALTIDEVKSLVTFMTNYAEKNAILLPGRIPGYKRDTIQLLPSSTTKKVHTLANTHHHIEAHT